MGLIIVLFARTFLPALIWRFRLGGGIAAIVVVVLIVVPKFFHEYLLHVRQISLGQGFKTVLTSFEARHHL